MRLYAINWETIDDEYTELFASNSMSEVLAKSNITQFMRTKVKDISFDISEIERLFIKEIKKVVGLDGKQYIITLT